jgi:hypothetical protein
VFYVGDRIKKPNQLNGKSANLNHVLLRKIYPSVRKAEEVPIKDIFMVMDCDHMVRLPPLVAVGHDVVPFFEM